MSEKEKEAKPKESVKKELKSATLSLKAKWNEQMNIIKEKTGIRGIYVVIILAISIVLVCLNIFDSLITNLVGTLYPAFWTMKSIEEGSDDDKTWLTYWVVFAFFTLIDMFSFIIVKVLPFYFVIKIVFLIWLFMPNSRGCHIIYHFVVKKIFKYFENNIDQFSDQAKKFADDAGLNSGTKHNKKKKI